MEIFRSVLTIAIIGATLIALIAFFVGYFVGIWHKQTKRLNDNNWKP